MGQVRCPATACCCLLLPLHHHTPRYILLLLLLPDTPCYCRYSLLQSAAACLPLQPATAFCCTSCGHTLLMLPAHTHTRPATPLPPPAHTPPPTPAPPPPLPQAS